MLEYVSSTFVSVSTLGEPIFATTLAFIFFKEVPNLPTVVGGAGVIIGLYIYIKSTGRKKPKITGE